MKILVKVNVDGNEEEFLSKDVVFDDERLFKDNISRLTDELEITFSIRKVVKESIKVQD